MKTPFRDAGMFPTFRVPLIRVSMMVLGCCLLGGRIRAMSVSWGSEYFSDLRDSYGNPLDDTFYMQLGYFENTLETPFTPDATNTAEWSGKWRVFDQAGYNPANSFDPLTGYFTREDIAITPTGGSTSEFGDLGLNYTGKEAYLWTYNSKTPGIGTEWLLARAADWIFPEGGVEGCCENDLPLQWSVSDFDSDPQVVPIWGGQGAQKGAGEYTVTTDNYTLQTFTFIPEPSTALLAAMGTAFALLRRRRPLAATGLNASLVAAVLAVGIASPCRAERIHWFGPTHKTNLTSTGELLDQTMVFELGLFTDGFVPDADNMDEWAAHWLAAQRANYSPDGKRFAGKFVVNQNDSPFTGGKPAYIWGFRGGVDAGEWILLRSDSWNWPVISTDPAVQAAKERNPLSALEWNAAQATAIVGTIQPASVPFLMQTANVSNASPPKTSWDQWLLTHMNGEVLNGLMDDPDGDGVGNLLEYVFGTLPRQVNAAPVMPMELVTDGAERFLQVTIPRRSDHAAALTVEVSSDLTHWNSGAGATVTVSDTPAGWVVRDLVPQGLADAKRFIRLKAELPAP